MIITLDPVRRGDWIIQASYNQPEEVIMVILFNIITFTTSVRFFYSETSANVYVEEVLTQSAAGKKPEKNQ